jgi:prepilin-type N-terminal cleavage/methylation domain-containing protein
MTRGSRGFTLVEISVVVLIIGLVASIAVPQIRKSIVIARSEALINDLRVYSQAYQHYMQEKGDWPPGSSSPGVAPAGMGEYLNQTNWAQKTPVGGLYQWETRVLHNGQRIQAAISVVSSGDNEVTTDRIQLEDIDRRIDDGNLDTGSFRLGFENQPLFIIEF